MANDHEDGPSLSGRPSSTGLQGGRPTRHELALRALRGELKTNVDKRLQIMLDQAVVRGYPQYQWKFNLIFHEIKILYYPTLAELVATCVKLEPFVGLKSAIPDVVWLVNRMIDSGCIKFIEMSQDPRCIKLREEYVGGSTERQLMERYGLNRGQVRRIIIGLEWPWA